MSKNTTELDKLIRDRARVAYHAKVNDAWSLFVKTVQVQQGSYSSALHDLGKKMVEALKIEQKDRVEQDAVEAFLKQFEKFGEEIANLQEVAHEH